MTKKKMKANDSRFQMQQLGAGYKVFTAFNTLFLLLVIFITAYPIYYVVAASLSDATALTRNSSPLIFPLPPVSLTAYDLVFRNPLVLTGYLNTFIILIVGLAFNLGLTIVGAYCLSLKNAMLMKPVSYMILFTMYFSGGMIPTYVLIRSLGMIDSLWSLILPGAINTYNLLIMRSAFAAIPDSLYEAAYLDGASHPRIMARIYVPLSGATLAVMLLYYAVGHWNAWFNASLYIRSAEKYPLQLVLRQILIMNENSNINATLTDNGEQALYADQIKYALIVVSTLPILILYPFLQKFFDKGVMIGALKG